MGLRICQEVFEKICNFFLKRCSNSFCSPIGAIGFCTVELLPSWHSHYTTLYGGLSRGFREFFYSFLWLWHRPQISHNSVCRSLCPLDAFIVPHSVEFVKRFSRIFFTGAPRLHLWDLHSLILAQGFFPLLTLLIISEV